MTEPLEHSHHVAAPVTNAFTKKIGPLPGYAYVVIIVLAVYLYRRYKGASAKAVVDPNAAGVATNALSTDPSASLGGGAYTGGGGALPAPSATSTQTNAQWASTAANALIASGYSATEVGNALSNFLNGSPLSSTENVIVSAAIKQFGEPPQGVLPVTVTPIPTPTPAAETYTWAHPAPGTVYRRNAADGAIYQVQPGGDPYHLAGWQWDQLQATYGAITIEGYGTAPKPVTPPVNHPSPAPAPAPKPTPGPRKYTVKSGDTLTSIAHHFYNNSDYMKIYNANKSVIGSNPNLIRPGMVLVIPT